MLIVQRLCKDCFGKRSTLLRTPQQHSHVLKNCSVKGINCGQESWDTSSKRPTNQKAFHSAFCVYVHICINNLGGDQIRPKGLQTIPYVKNPVSGRAASI